VPATIRAFSFDVLAGALEVFLCGCPRQRWANAPTMDSQIELNAIGPCGHHAAIDAFVIHAFASPAFGVRLLPERHADPENERECRGHFSGDEFIVHSARAALHARGAGEALLHLTASGSAYSSDSDSWRQTWNGGAAASANRCADSPGERRNARCPRGVLHRAGLVSQGTMFEIPAGGRE
jgi:hypothetical protein